MKGLLLGSGGREHVLAFALKQANVDFACIPGNPGINQLCKCIDMPMSDSFIFGYLKKHPVDYTIINSEKYLISDLNTKLRNNNIKVFGPDINQVKLESSKIFAKNLMQKYNLPIANYQVFNSYQDIYNYIFTCKFPQIIKTDNSIIVNNLQEAIDIINLLRDSFKSLIIEDYLQGDEFVLPCLLDGKYILPLIPVKSYKQIYDYNSANTEDMGSIAPFNLDNNIKNQLSNIINNVKIMLENENLFYQGCLQIKFIIANNTLYILGFNVRFGDPATQAIIPLLKTNFFNLIQACFNGILDKINVEWYNQYTCCLVLVSQGYPFKYKSYKPLKINDTDCIVLHAGTYFNDERNQLFTNGGRALNLIAIEDTLELAREKVYKNIRNINYENIFYRANIGL